MSTTSEQQGRITVAGHPYAPIGMGEQARTCFRALKAVELSANMLDIYQHYPKPDPDFVAEFGPSLTRRLSPHINIFSINGDEVDPVLRHLDDPNFEKAHNIVFPAWELETYPEEWAEQLSRFDEVWTPSRFVADAISSSVDIPVTPMNLAVAPKLSSFLTRRALGLPEHDFLFLFFFDFSSYSSRKNPEAVVEAFKRALAKAPKARMHLVLKMKGEQAGQAQLKALERAIKPLEDQITVIDRTLTANETGNLIRDVDCFVSLHRSEGFGLGLAEAMALGTPVISTGWSGNMDFMNEETAWLVKHEMVDVKRGEYPFGEGQRWADPDIDDAAAKMIALWEDRDAGLAKARRARREITRLLSPRAIGLRFLDRLEKGPAAGVFEKLQSIPA